MHYHETMVVLTGLGLWWLRLLSLTLAWRWPPGGPAAAGIALMGRRQFCWIGLSLAAVGWHTPTSQRNDSFCQCQEASKGWRMPLITGILR